MSAQQIGKLIPTRFEKYRLRGVSKSSEMKVGTLRYTLCERNYGSGAKHVRILLFDYVDAPIMFQQAMRNHEKMQAVESDSLTFRPVEMLGSTGWEGMDLRTDESKLILGINQRFFLTLSGEHVDLAELKNIFQQINIDHFPK